MATYYTADAPQQVNVPPMYQFNPAPEIHHIRDWLPWSIISLIVGWGLGGIFPLVFSLICRSKKRKNDVEGARLMSTLALIFNILITIGGIIGWIAFIIGMVFYVRAINDIMSTNP
jgi:hypothetical protein